MRRATVVSDHDVQVEDAPEPQPGPGEGVVQRGFAALARPSQAELKVLVAVGATT
jgi:hypothetical protein